MTSHRAVVHPPTAQTTAQITVQTSADADIDKGECRAGCGACCIAPSISSPIPGMPNGKPAGVRCIQLTADNRCALFGHPDRPAVCVRLRPHREMCGHSAHDALIYLTNLEELTR